MAIFKFRDLCCPVKIVKLVEMIEGGKRELVRDVDDAIICKKSQEWLVEVYIEMTPNTPLFKKFYFDTEEECEEAFKEIVYDLEDKGWGK